MGKNQSKCENNLGYYINTNRLFVLYFQEQHTRDLWLAIQAVRQKFLQLEEKVGERTVENTRSRRQSAVQKYLYGLNLGEKLEKFKSQVIKIVPRLL